MHIALPDSCRTLQGMLNVRSSLPGQSADIRGAHLWRPWRVPGCHTTFCRQAFGLRVPCCWEITSQFTASMSKRPLLAAGSCASVGSLVAQLRHSSIGKRCSALQVTASTVQAVATWKGQHDIFHMLTGRCSMYLVTSSFSLPSSSGLHLPVCRACAKARSRYLSLQVSGRRPRAAPISLHLLPFTACSSSKRFESSKDHLPYTGTSTTSLIISF